MSTITTHNNGNNNDGNNNDVKHKSAKDAAMTHYTISKELTPYGQQQAQCEARGACYNKTLVCPAQCPKMKPKKNRKQKGCLIDCSSRCEVTCRWRKPNCNGFGSLCYDLALWAVTGRTRDFTWVQALSVMFDTHTLVLSARRVSHWDDNVDALIVRWDGEEVNIPTDGEAEWRVSTGERQVEVERTDDVNSVRVKVTGLVEMDVQRYNSNSFELSELVDGVLGKTYRPGYVSPVRRGVPMPMMGGEDKYQTPSLYSTVCKVCRFQRLSGSALI
ncbi:late embryogenesis abundant protein-related [Actinidia rufa]|uniref:Late embryogenesis abundant protein-related n=1 Tax=Actinidia rufa TaxID=165716 RepID=A0A7J0HBI5_9ERIC|nr:late embryogenesis abundant protein-related [Actinidia rufa]